MLPYQLLQRTSSFTWLLTCCVCTWLHINVSELLHTSNTNFCNVMWPVHIQLWPELVQELQLHSRNSSKDCLQSMRLENAEGKLQCCGLHLPLLSMRLHWCLPPAIPTSCTGATTILLPGCHHGACLSQAVIAISFSSLPMAFQVAAPQLGGAPATLCNWLQNTPSTL